MSFSGLKTNSKAKPIEYYSTNNYAERVHFPEALLNGMASNHGLYMLGRQDVPKLSKKKIKKMTDQTYAEIAFEVLQPYLQWHISDDELGSLLRDAYDETIIPTPVQNVRERLYIMWLTKGPTCSFKDYAARFYARILNYFLRKRGLTRIVLVATSGDTGGAVADSLKGMSNAFVVVFYPQGSISEGQRRQMTTLHENIFAVAVNGDFDICQELVKYLMGDKKCAYDISKDEDIFTSANSISLGRQLSQTVYPFYGYSRMGANGEPMISVIPTGNMGDLMGTVMAKDTGLPIEAIICGLNENSAFEEFLRTGKYIVKPKVDCPSSAMIVPNPSGLARLFDWYGGHVYDRWDEESGLPVEKGIITRLPDLQSMGKDIVAYRITNSWCYQAMKNAYRTDNLILDPHGAVAWDAFERFRFNTTHHLALLYETADPGKFPDNVEKAIGMRPSIPPQMQAQESLPERIYTIDAPPDKDEEGNTTLSAAQIAQVKELLASLFKPIFLT
ncbi:MAG: threonine synthase [Patescibacteria group bacterium]